MYPQLLGLRLRMAGPAQCVLERKQSVSRGLASVPNAKGISCIQLKHTNYQIDMVQMPTIEQGLPTFTDSPQAQDSHQAVS